MEQWKTIDVGAEVNVSDAGRIRKNGRIKPLSITGKYYKIGRGYLATRVGRKLMKVHRLVAIAFIPNPKNLPEVNHINGITTDNRACNLEWTTPRNNQLHALRIGLRVPIKGSQIGTSKLTEDKVILCRKLHLSGVAKIEIARRINISRTQVGRIIKGESWAHLPNSK